MRTIVNAAIVAGIFGLSTTSANAQSPLAVTHTAPGTPAVSGGAKLPAADTYWTSTQPAPPTRKPSALRRLFGRLNASTGKSSEEMTVYRDTTTGRTNAGGSKPWMQPGR